MGPTTYWPIFDSILGENHGAFYSLPIKDNPRRGISLASHLLLLYRDSSGLDGSAVNKSVVLSVRLAQAVPHDWRGPLVLMCDWNTNPEADALSEYHHGLDMFTTYMDSPHKETLSATARRGIKVTCHGEQ
ncbi:hypothetical protein K469DRAFT_688968 [Zopfia rhizophila CBS 207.26]|uniref:Uncharacterized protein n=1 Tax=Zopfia rhizophila CBS 207.26 TaxID=1314779 RepID=A0A6A6ERG2_9PEZI|nr:hypothetical protein K469DRAFT_688968 [Zopfia rhizophila CBS 207.26]